MNKTRSLVIILSKTGFTIGCTFLYALSLWIIGGAVFSIIRDAMGEDFTIFNLLDEVGLIVFSIAVIDVAKYLMIEEVFKGNEKRHPKEAVGALTKFVLIIVTALSLEGLVLTIETAKTDVSKIYYPVALFITAIIFLVGLGVYRYLSGKAEKEK